MSESVGPLGSLIPGAVLIMYPTLHGFCSTSVSEPNNFLDQLLGDSGAPEVLMVNVSVWWQVSMADLFNSCVYIRGFLSILSKWCRIITWYNSGVNQGGNFHFKSESIKSQMSS